MTNTVKEWWQLILYNCPIFLAQLSNAINLKEIAEKTEGYSGSDLRELCRDAAMYRVRDYVRKEQMRQIAQQLQDCQEEERYDSYSDTHKIFHSFSLVSYSTWPEQSDQCEFYNSTVGIIQSTDALSFLCKTFESCGITLILIIIKH